jgi:chemotaxis signal transduction protein
VTEAPASLTARVADLRSAFDRAFAVPLQSETAVNQDLLAIRAGGEPYAIRLSEVGSLFVDRPVTRIPASNGSVHGIGGFRGVIVPVHNLPMLLGHTPSQAPRWLVMAAAAPIALAFELFEGHLRVPADAILPQQPHAQMRGYAPEFVRSGTVVRPVLHLASVIASLDASDPRENPPQRRSEQP